MLFFLGMGEMLCDQVVWSSHRRRGVEASCRRVVVGSTLRPPLSAPPLMSPASRAQRRDQ